MIDSALKQRLIGATVLVSAAVIFIPMLLDGTDPTENLILTSNIPQRPDNQFKSRIVPLEPSDIPPEDETRAVEKPPAVADVGNTSKTQEKPPSDTPPLADADKSVQSGISAWAVQLGSFSDKANATQLETALRNKGFAAFIDAVSDGKEISYKVRVGPELNEGLAKELAGKIESSFNTKVLVIRYP